MHTYRKSRDEQLWTVGYWIGNPVSDHGANWEPLSDHASERDAMERVNYLNGGNTHVNTYVMEP